MLHLLYQIYLCYVALNKDIHLIFILISVDIPDHLRTINFQKGYPATINHKKQSEFAYDSAKKIVGNKAGEPYLSMGAEDFSYFLQQKPGAFFFVGSSPNDRKPMSTPHHCSHFDIEEEALIIGTSVFIQIIEDLLITG